MCEVQILFFLYLNEQVHLLINSNIFLKLLNFLTWNTLVIVVITVLYSNDLDKDSVTEWLEQSVINLVTNECFVWLIDSSTNQLS